MMTFEDKKAAERAYVRAQIEKPRLRELSFGRYEVTSQAGDRQYNLDYRKQAGKLVADCSCPAGRKNSCCKHALAGYSHFKMRVSERSAQAAPPVLYCECGVEGADCGTGRCQDCDLTWNAAYLEVLRSVQEDDE
jgi:hypothetical protein